MNIAGNMTYQRVNPTEAQKASALAFYAPEGQATPEATVSDYNGQIAGKTAVARYIAAGNATMTMVSKSSGTRFTFKFTRPDDVPGKDRPIWAKVLTGSDNESDYTFLGTLWADASLDAGLRYNHSLKSSVTRDAPSVMALRWLIAALGKPEEVLDQAEIWHEGRCGRCGRKLTVPSSVQSGFGPECIKAME